MKSGEFTLIDRITKGLKTDKQVRVGIGDDAAVFKPEKGYELIVTTDSTIENVHFLRKFYTPEQIGQKAMLVNISDISAMGGIPQYALVNLVFPKALNTKYVEKIYQGIREVCSNKHIGIIGGNISSGELSITICLIGKAKAGKAVTRSGAQPGDLVAVTGNLGDASAGYDLMCLHKGLNKFKQLTNREIQPPIRVKEAQVIAKYATSMIDISDGLSSDILHICDQSKVGVVIDQTKLPVSFELKQAAKELKKNPYDIALYGIGEDYELCFTVPKRSISKVIREVRLQTKTNITVIGEVLAQKQGRWVQQEGTRTKLEAKGWNHFKS